MPATKMIAVVDSSVIVSTLVEAEPHHKSSVALFDQSRRRRGGGSHSRLALYTHSHALAETFSTLTGGRLGWRIPPEAAVKLIEESVLAYVEVVALTAIEMVAGLRGAPGRGVRGGAIYDYLHLLAARKVNADRLYTLDLENFRSFHRTGDPEVVAPA